MHGYVVTIKAHHENFLRLYSSWALTRSRCTVYLVYNLCLFKVWNYTRISHFFCLYSERIIKILIPSLLLEKLLGKISIQVNISFELSKPTKNIEVYMSWSIIQQYIQENIPEKVCSLLLPFPSIWWSRNFFLLHGCLWTFSLVFRLHRIGISAATS